MAELQEFLREKEERERVAADVLEAEAEAERAKQPTVIPGWEPTDDDKAMAEELEAICEFVKDRPVVTAGVLRWWLKDGEPGDLAQLLEEQHDGDSSPQ